LQRTEICASASRAVDHTADHTADRSLIPGRPELRLERLLMSTLIPTATPQIARFSTHPIGAFGCKLETALGR
jgi:hypothetical protein